MRRGSQQATPACNEQCVCRRQDIRKKAITSKIAKIGKVFVANGDVATQAQVDEALKTLYDTTFIKKSYKDIDVKATEAAEAK